MSYVGNQNLYISIIQDFVDEKISGLEFEKEFMRLWKQDRDEEWDEVGKLSPEMPEHEGASHEILDIYFAISTPIVLTPNCGTRMTSMMNN